MNTGLFSNLQADKYWSGTEFVVNTVIRGAWEFDFNLGGQGGFNLADNMFAWAVHNGDVSAAVPAPSAMLLMGSGLVGLLAWRRFGRG